MSELYPKMIKELICELRVELEQHIKLSEHRRQEHERVSKKALMMEESRDKWKNFAQRLVARNIMLLRQIDELRDKKADQIAIDSECDFKQSGELLKGNMQFMEEQSKTSLAALRTKIDSLGEEIKRNCTQSAGQKYEYLDKTVTEKFVCADHYWKTCPHYISSDSVEYVNYKKDNLNHILQNIASYKKQLFIMTWWKCMNPFSGCSFEYSKLIRLCREWKRLRPDGEIHCIYDYQTYESPAEPSEELSGLLTTCEKYVYISGSASYIIQKYWPEFAASILSCRCMHNKTM